MKNFDLVNSQKGVYTTGDFLNCLKEVGVCEGDDICVHSDMTALGMPACPVKEVMTPRFCGAFVDVLKAAVGEGGTVLMPTFTYSFCRGEAYDIDKSRSTVGVLTEYFRCLPGVWRTRDPIFSFAVSGKRAAEYLDISNQCFGENSVFDRMYGNKCKVLLLGTHFGNSMTCIHYVEWKHGVPYRFIKTFTGEIIQNGKASVESFDFFVRKLDEPSIASPVVIDGFLEETNNNKRADFGDASVLCVDLHKLTNDLAEVLRGNPRYLLGL